MFKKEDFRYFPTEYEMTDLEDNDKRYNDVKKIIEIRNK